MDSQRHLRIDQSYDSGSINQAAMCSALALGQLWRQDDVESVRLFYATLRERIDEIDRQMCEVCTRFKDSDALARWRTRKHIVDQHFRSLDMRLSAIGSDPKAWDEILKSMGMITALSSAAEQVLALNQLT